MVGAMKVADWLKAGEANVRLAGVNKRPASVGVTVCMPVVEMKLKVNLPLESVAVVADCVPARLTVTPASAAPFASTTRPVMLTEVRGSSSLSMPFASRSMANRRPSPAGTPMKVSSAPVEAALRSVCKETGASERLSGWNVPSERRRKPRGLPP